MKSYGTILWGHRIFENVYDVAWTPMIDDNKGQNTGMYKNPSSITRVHVTMMVPVRLLPKRKSLPKEEILARVRFAFCRWLDTLIAQHYTGSVDGEYEYMVEGMNVKDGRDCHIDDIDWIFIIHMNMSTALYNKLKKNEDDR